MCTAGVDARRRLSPLDGPSPAVFAEALPVALPRDLNVLTGTAGRARIQRHVRHLSTALAAVTVQQASSDAASSGLIVHVTLADVCAVAAACVGPLL